MPYTICVNKPGCLPEADPRAVATLDEAREHAREVIEDRDRYGGSHHRDNARALPGTGGVIGPLPDGYVIDVTYVTWDELAALAGITGDYARPEPEDMDEILYIYNHQGD